MIIENPNLDIESAFLDFEQDVKLSSILHFPKKGDQLFLAVLSPMLFQGKPKINIVIDTEFTDPKTNKVTQSKQYIVRFALFNFTNRKVDWAKTEFVGIPLARSYAEQIAVAYQKGFKVATQEFNLIEFQKSSSDGKALITFLPQVVKMPDELWEKGKVTPTWDELLEAHNNMQNNIAAKKNPTKAANESTPW